MDTISITKKSFSYNGSKIRWWINDEFSYNILIESSMEITTVQTKKTSHNECFYNLRYIELRKKLYIRLRKLSSRILLLQILPILLT